MFIPKKVSEFAKKLEEDRLAKEKKEADRKAKVEQKQAEEKRKLDQERENRAPELLDALDVIFSWLHEFIPSEECANILKNKCRVLLFVASYWLGKKCPEGTITEWAAIEFRRDGHIYYCERHKARESRSIDLLDMNIFFRGHVDKESFISKLHPDFIVEWAEEIKSGKVWERVLSS